MSDLKLSTLEQLVKNRGALMLAALLHSNRMRTHCASRATLPTLTDRSHLLAVLLQDNRMSTLHPPSIRLLVSESHLPRKMKPMFTEATAERS